MCKDDNKYRKKVSVKKEGKMQKVQGKSKERGERCKKKRVNQKKEENYEKQKG